MKQGFVFLISLLFFSSNTDGQVVDSTAYKQIDSVLLQAKFAEKNQEMSRAIEWVDSALVLAQQNIGIASEAYINVQYAKAMIYYNSGNYTAARQFMTEAYTACKEQLSMENKLCRSCLSILSVLENQLGNSELAASYLLTLINWQDENDVAEDVGFAGYLVNLGQVYTRLEKFDLAEHYYFRAKNLFELSLKNTTDQFYIACIVNIGYMYNCKGDYQSAEEYLLKAKKIIEIDLKDTDHPFYLNCLMNLSLVYYSLNIYEKYERLAMKACRLFEKKFGNKHPNYAGALINLSNYYCGVGAFDKAKPLLLEAKKIFEEDLNELNHPFYFNCIANLGIMYFMIDEPEKAKETLLKSLEVRRKYAAFDQLGYARGLIWVANALAKLREFEASEKYYNEAWSLFEGKIDASHPLLITFLGAQAYRCEMKGENADAVNYMKQIEASNQASLINSISHLSEMELNAYLRTNSINQERLLSISNKMNYSDSSLAVHVYNNSLFYKGFILNASKQIKRLAYTDSEAAEQLAAFRKAKEELAKMYVLPFADRDTLLLERLEEEAQSIEKLLVKTVAGYGESMRQVEWEEVQQQLAPGELVVEFFHFNYRFETPTDSVIYGALLLKGGDQPPQLISLFEEQQLRDLLSNDSGDKAAKINEFYSEELAYDLIWKPLKDHLGGAHTVYFAASGLLHRLNIPALVSLQQSGKKIKMIQLSSSRELVLNSNNNQRNDNACLFGGIKYGATTGVVEVQQNTDMPGTRALLGFDMIDSSLRTSTWKYLDWTAVEVGAVSSILTSAALQTHLFEGEAATEEQFKSLSGSSPRILHLATHGFFFPENQLNAKYRTNDLSGSAIFRLSDDPMIRSGLILAGANHVWKTGRPYQADMEDGVLTAYEIGQMDLSNTELVVLSACETGLGDIKGNEGVYGLQRAFKAAGIKYLIMSLWQVPDYQTQQLMKLFYNNWLSGEMNIPEAFRSAQQSMKDRYDDPYLWAGFVLVE